MAFHYKRPLSSGNSNSKLTKKFPISASVHKLSALGRGKVGDHAFAIVLLDEAAGMGIDRIDRWTAHKWCLFLSVCSVFAYGAAGLAYAVLTWFGSESFLYLRIAVRDIDPTLRPISLGETLGC